MINGPANGVVSGLGAAVVLAAVAGVCAPAQGQLRPEQVLVVYDSRLINATTLEADSLLVAEHYAGSARVPGGQGGRPGTRPGVRVFNLASASPAVAAVPGPDLDYAQFSTLLRDPIRAWLTANDPRGEIRAIVLTKGISHRIYETNYAGENPAAAGARFNAGTYCSASVDSELTLLWQNLGGTTDTPAGTRSTGWIVNPYWTLSQPVDGWSTRAIRTAKGFTLPSTNPALNNGMAWGASPASLSVAPGTAQLAVGDFYIVTRLDGRTLASVRAALDRARGSAGSGDNGGGVLVNVETACFILDESESNGAIDTVNNAERDNATVGYIQGVNTLRGGDDYEQTRFLMTGTNGAGTSAPADANPPARDARFTAANVFYNAAAGATQFLCGPVVQLPGVVYSPPSAQVVSGPVLLLASYGANHSGQPTDGGRLLPTTFSLAPGAVFNTVESFNGRELGSVTPANSGQPTIFQGQVADFIAAGGTFGIGNVWEPTTFVIADNLQLVRGFLQGNLSWGEAAYSALPGLSYMQVVIGDPLARVVRSREDVNGDGRMNIEDLYAWHLAPTDINRDAATGDPDRRILESSVRPTRDTDTRGRQR